jgi:membrane fusion protein, macrolide-specific efflux system
MWNKKIVIPLLVVTAAAAIYFVPKFLQKHHSSGRNTMTREISPHIGSLQNIISDTGTVLPRNRLEIKPPVAGRVDQILVQEGDMVKTGQIVAWMSSTDRAALLDAAGGQGKEAVKHWQDVYKPIALIAPIDGEVIVARMQPGQTVTVTDDVIVLSDTLIVRAQVDETDIGKISLKQPATITLDAYPDNVVKAKVDHIYYESVTISNVTIYEVDLLPETIPPFFRSGMNATVNFVVDSRDNILLLPVDAVTKIKDKSFVFLKGAEGEEPIKQPVVTGISDDKNIEIISGITADDVVVVKAKKYSLPKNDAGSNPFMVQGRPAGTGKKP